MSDTSKQGQRFRKKPVVIEAVQLTWANWNEICDFVPKPWFVRGVWLDNNGKPLPESETNFKADGDKAIGLLMQTLESEQFLAQGGDWIIKGVKGEFYPCKPDIFAAIYESAQPSAPAATPTVMKSAPVLKFAKATPPAPDLREAAQAVLQLIEGGILVRNTADDEDGLKYARSALRLTLALVALRAALAGKGETHSAMSSAPVPIKPASCLTTNRLRRSGGAAESRKSERIVFNLAE